MFRHRLAGLASGDLEVKCPQCQTANVAEAAFCDECGARLETNCPSCGEPNRPSAKFCNQCGQAIGQLKTPRLAKFAVPRSYTPSHLAEKILTSRGAIEGERKLVTNLFADLKSSMELLADRDPEEAHELLDPVVGHMMDAVHRYEGTVSEVRGDGIMAIFGAPVAHEDHAQRACYAALDMQAAVRRYSEEVIHTHGVKPQIRIGLNSGEVVVRAIGSDLRVDYSTVGKTTHLAGRMEQLADPGSILLTANTLRLAEGYIEVKPLGPVPVKGLEAPVEVFELTGAGPVRSRLHAAMARGLTQFVGRETELAQLHRALGHAADGHGQVAAIVGEAGVGKSRLVWEVVHSHRVEGWVTVQASSVSYGKATPYLPIVDLLKTYFQIESIDDHRTIRERLTGKLLTLDRSLETILSALLALMDVPVEDKAWDALDARQRRQRILDAVKQLLLRESRVQPLLVVFEDLHWIDSETQTLLDSLVESVPTARLLLLINYRPEYSHRWSNKSYYTQLGLEPLPPESAEELLTTLLGTDTSLGTLKRFLIERTEGNPFFLEESVRALAETGVLTGEKGRYRTTMPGESVQVPSTVHAVLAARIDRLPPAERQLLSTAAVIGKVIPFALLQAVCEQDEGPLRQALTNLQVTEFLYETALYPEPEYTFKHSLTQEVAYGNLLNEQRRNLHARIVEAIEGIYGDRLNEQVEKLAHHAALAQQWPRAVQYLRQAGAKSAARCSYPEAVAYLEQALVALGHLPETRERQYEEIDLRFSLRSSLQALGDHERVFEHLRDAERLASALEDQDRIGWTSAYLSQYLWRMGNPTQAVELGQRALTISSSLNDFALDVVSNFFMGQGYFNVGNYGAAIDHCRRNVAALKGDQIYNRLGLTGLPSVLSRIFLAWSLAERGEFEEAALHGKEAIKIGEAVGHPYDIADAQLAMGYIRLLRRELEQAVSTLEFTVDLCESGGLGVIHPTAAALLGLAHALSGRLDEALLAIEESEVGAPKSRIFIFDTSTATIAPGTVYLLAGKLEQAAAMAKRAFELAAKRGFRGSLARAELLLGQIAARRDPADVRQAERHFNRALAKADELRMLPLAAECHCVLGQLDRDIGNDGDSERHLATAAQLYAAMGIDSLLAPAGVATK